eukprot:CAMPEP_0114563490 /NCGR_PEP_ID=MMETSP0114-20121206/13140_1 /TAXON_ID=31324 /ORGANISM="Goniomonas sp, Strain m" /LENGTH=58 /DNA_ID=CAMNT_0001749345 /DNA_START=16 /DNA_END=192 /DNA_ORIENTATION=+
MFSRFPLRQNGQALMYTHVIAVTPYGDGPGGCYVSNSWFGDNCDLGATESVTGVGGGF